MASVTVTGNTALEAQLDDELKNPDLTAGTTGKQTVHLTLVFDGVSCDAGDIYDMVNAAYGTVQSPKGSIARGTYIFNISA